VRKIPLLVLSNPEFFWFISFRILCYDSFLSSVIFIPFKMVVFEEPDISKDPNPGDSKTDTPWDSPPETAVNTAAPSQAPSIHGSNEDRDIENAITTEKVLS
jgi:hypothetical protein